MGEWTSQCEECGSRLFMAGEEVAAGTYLRVDDESFVPVTLPAGGSLPASFDGHRAVYRIAAAPCICERSKKANLQHIG